MERVVTVGLDIAKSVFQVHAVNAAGEALIRRRLRRSEVLRFFEALAPCLVGIEACATGHFWARELRSLGHDVRLMPPAYVKPYVKRQKNDAADAEAICEAVTRPSMRFVPVKSEDQQGVLMLHRVRELMIRQRVMLVNALRAHLAEFGVVANLGAKGVDRLEMLVEDDESDLIPEMARAALTPLVRQLNELREKISELDRRIATWHRSNETSQLLATIPGVGPITASAFAATVADARPFKSGRQLAAWIGLAPRQNSSGGKERLGRITKQGDPYLRRLLVVGAHAVLRYCRQRKAALAQWAAQLIERRPVKLVAVALANKMARIIWAVMKTGEAFRASPS